jgi:vitamin B12 transporter
VVALASAAGALCAQNSVFQPPSKDTAVLRPVVVTSTRDSVTQVAPTASTTVISGEELRAEGIISLAQALSVISSMTTVQAGSFGATTSLFTRGGQSNYTLIMVDGSPVNDPGGFADLANLTTDNIDRIEIVRGPGSVLYGSNAISGVIQIFTRRRTTADFANVVASGGSYGTRDYQLGGGFGKETISASLDASRSNTNGIYSFNNAAKNDVYSGVIHFGSPGSAHLDIAGRQNRSVYNFPTDFTGAQVDSSQWTTSRLTVASVDGGFYMGKKVEFRVLAAGTENQSTSQRLQESGADTMGVFYVDPSTTKQWSIDARLAIHANASTAITLGGEYDDQQIKSSDSSFSADFNDTSSFAHSRTNTAYYANATGDIGSKFSYNAGIRITNSDLFGSNTSYRVGAGYVLLPKTIVRGSIGSAFNEPSFYEQYSTGFTTGNPDLKPETGMSWEIGLQQSISDGRGVMGVTYFSQKFTNMIQYDPGVPFGDPNYSNIAKADASGIEAELRLAVSKEWFLDFAYTWLETKVVDALSSGDPGATLIQGQPLLRRPANEGSVSLSYDMAKHLYLNVQGQYVGSRADVDFSTDERVTLPSYFLLNAGMLLTLKSDADGRFIGITGRANNIFNHGYQQTVGFAAPGRTLLVGIRLGVGY